MATGASSTVALVASGAVGPLVESGEAAIVYNSVNLNIPATTGGLYINVETGVSSTSTAAVPGWDINPWSSSALNWFSPSTPTGGVMMRYPGVTTGTNVGSLDLGNLVGSAGSYGATATTFGTGTGEWALNAPNYFGFRFTAADSLVHYGWGRIDIGATATVRSIMELAFEDVAGTSILVGDTGLAAVPEPSSLAMMATGAVGLLGWRMRRRFLAKAAG